MPLLLTNIILLVFLVLLSSPNLLVILDKTLNSINVELPVNASCHLFVYVGAENHLNWSFKKQNSNYSDFKYIHSLPKRSF